MLLPLETYVFILFTGVYMNIKTYQSPAIMIAANELMNDPFKER